MNDIKVSVLVPVFGVEKYIEKCAQSLFNQTMKEGIEFIFTDDCSPDRSMDIVRKVLEDFPERKSQVVFLRHPENMGLAEARVTGLKAAKGEYVIHCDSDDWVDEDMYRQLYEEAKRTDADIVGCDAFFVYDGKTKYERQDFHLTQDEILPKIIMGDHIGGYLWNRLIKRSFYLNGGYRANRGTTFWEDMAVTIPMHTDTNKVSYVPKALYYYRRTISDSMSALLSDKAISSGLEVIKELENIPLKKEWYDALKRRKKKLLFYRVWTVRDRDENGWRNIEYPAIKEESTGFTFNQTISKILLSHKFDTLQKLYVIAYKLFSPSLWIKRIANKVK